MSVFGYVPMRPRETAILLMSGHKVIYGNLDRCHGYGDKAIPG